MSNQTKDGRKGFNDAKGKVFLVCLSECPVYQCVVLTLSLEINQKIYQSLQRTSLVFWRPRQRKLQGGKVAVPYLTKKIL